MVDRGVEKELLQGAWPGNLGQLALGGGQRLARHHRSGPGVPCRRDGRGRPHPDRCRPAPDPGEALVLPWPEPGPLEAMLEAVRRNAEGALLRQALAGRRGDPAQVAEGLGTLTLRRFAAALRDHDISLEEE